MLTTLHDPSAPVGTCLLCFKRGRWVGFYCSEEHQARATNVEVGRTYADQVSGRPPSYARRWRR